MDRQMIDFARLEELTGSEVLHLLTDYHGLQLLDDGFHQHLINEGIIDDDSDDSDEEGGAE